MKYTKEELQAMLDHNDKLAGRQAGRMKTFHQPHYVKFDVMLWDRWICTLRYPHSPIFVLTVKELEDFVIEQKPSLKDKPFKIAFCK